MSVQESPNRSTAKRAQLTTINEDSRYMTSPFGRSKLSIGEDILLFKDEDDVQGTLKSN
jgi:hypothetical protein